MCVGVVVLTLSPPRAVCVRRSEELESQLEHLNVQHKIVTARLEAVITKSETAETESVSQITTVSEWALACGVSACVCVHVRAC